MRQWMIAAACAGLVVAMALCAPGRGGAALAAPGAVSAQDAEAAARATKGLVDETVDAANDAKAKAVFRSRCTRPCHGARKTCLPLGLKAKNGWDTTVTMMQLKGAHIDAVQKELLVEWLWDLPADSSPPCE